MERSRFSRNFERVYGNTPLPPVYRDFILSDAYLPYRRASVRGLYNYGPETVEVRLDSPALLNPASLYDAAGIEEADAEGYHPIATLPGSPQFLAVAVAEADAPVYLLHHETGAFHRAFDTFQIFLAGLRPGGAARTARARNARR